MPIRPFVVLVLGLALSFVNSAAAQQAKKLPRIGFLAPGTASSVTDRKEAFVQGLRELGYTENQNILIDYRYADGNFDRLAVLAAELVNSEVDVIVAQNYRTASAASALTKTIPIIVAHGYDPVAAGLTHSLARPHGNVTGLGNRTNDLGTKRLEVLKETLPLLKRVAVLPGPGGSRMDPDEVKEMELVAPSLQLQIQVLNVRGANDFETAFETAVKARAGGLAVISDATGTIMSNRKRIVELTLKHRLPSIFPANEYTVLGGLMSYGPDTYGMYRRVAYYVDRILRGSKPADLPVERTSKAEFVINLKTAQQIGVTIPPDVLQRANKVIR